MMNGVKAPRRVSAGLAPGPARWLMAFLLAFGAAVNRPALAQGDVLGPDDQISIRVMDGLALGDKPIPIGANGNITLPLVGRVRAAGRTVEQLEAELTTLLKPYVQDPQVTITVAEFRSQPVSVIGAVNTPGVVYLNGRKSLYEVLSLAGGPKDTAGSAVTITRLAENGPIPLPGAATDPAGRFSSARLEIQQILSGQDPAANIEVKPRDVIAVSQANASMVYVVGDVQRAGGFSLGPQRTISVLSALSMAGGLGRTARPDRAKIFRNRPGQAKHEEIAVDLKQILAGRIENFGLRPDDILVVPTSSRKHFTTMILPATIASAVAAAIYAGVIY